MTDPSTPHRPEPSPPEHRGAGEYWTPPPTPYDAPSVAEPPARRSRRGLWRGLAVGAVAAAGLAVAIPAIAASNQQPTGPAAAVTGYGEGGPAGEHGAGPGGGRCAPGDDTRGAQGAPGTQGTEGTQGTQGARPERPQGEGRGGPGQAPAAPTAPQGSVEG